MRYDAVLYDLDGTLIDSIPSILKAFRQTFLDVTGDPGDETYFLSTIGIPLSEAFEPFDPALRQRLFDVCKEYSDRYLRETADIFPRIREDLRGLQCEGVRQGVVTSKRREPARYSLEKFEIVDFFEVIVTKEDTERHKPFPDPLLEGVRRLGISDPAGVLYVGDSVHDLRCARNAGMDCAVVEWTRMPREEIAAESPRFWIRYLKEDISCILCGGEL